MDDTTCLACHQFLLQCIPKKGPIRSTTIRLKSQREAAENEVRSAMRTRRLRKTIAMLPAAEDLATVNDSEDVDGEDDDAIGSEDPNEIGPHLQLDKTDRTDDIYAWTQDCEPYDSVLDVDQFLPGLRNITDALGLELVPHQPNATSNPCVIAPSPSIPLRNPEHVLYGVILGVRTLARHHGYDCVSPAEVPTD